MLMRDDLQYQQTDLTLVDHTQTDQTDLQTDHTQTSLRDLQTDLLVQIAVFQTDQTDRQTNQTLVDHTQTEQINTQTDHPQTDQLIDHTQPVFHRRYLTSPQYSTNQHCPQTGHQETRLH